MKIEVNKLSIPCVEELKVELVERKGLGHPDFMADSIMERFALNLCKEYMKRFGQILHFNVDKGEIVGGQVRVAWKGGEVLKPITVFFSGRATQKVDGEEIDIKGIAIRSAKEWIKENFRFLDADKHLRYIVETKSGAANLVDIFKRQFIGANDTSIGSAYAPMSKTEKLVYELERFLNSKEFKKEYPYTGEDVKVLCARIRDEFHITFAMSFIDRFIENLDDYFEKKEIVLNEVKDFISARVEKFKIFFNTLDRKDRGINGIYLTVTGTSAEMGDDGSVGRGNRVNGVIPFNRWISMEATSGKNPISHVGKVYNVMAQMIANRIYDELKVKEVYVQLMSQIGHRIDDPYLVNVSIIGEFDEKKVKSIVKDELARINEISLKLIKGEIQIF